MTYYSKYVDYLDVLGGTWTPVVRLANDLGVTDDTARHAIRRLAERGRVATRHDPINDPNGRLEARATEEVTR